MSNWVSGNYYLNQMEMEHNATIIAQIFRDAGWTDQAIAAMLGNMQSESSINPGIWEGLDDVAKGGYGLVQWTPYTNYADWAGDGWEDNGDRECDRILWELDTGVQWYATSSYPLSFKQFSQSTDDPGYLAYAWLYNYERPGSLDQPIRKTRANQWYEWLTGEEPGPTFELPYWLLYKFRR